MNSFISFNNTLNNTEKQKYQEFVASKKSSLPSEVKSDWEFEALRKVCCAHKEEHMDTQV